ncbi:TPA: hypothetical protein P7L42_003307 [Vibrio cholerae]|uniref:conjugal transfer protein TraN n=1 Tax=Vibrio cholerae TaxID=666 RepID=UPI000E0A808A|nr:conjugal transfer protein TraN [Vibrio cholerae]MCX9672160.1 conjugal transfer protein TraN [Vibrio cholerae]MCX9680804.1 conjugal transfer protein TraN [Vibrio cholerae]MCX9686823.1 conjugal transfer protein TraN [Vibrio cholerae]MCX9698306.1 conjugal transfer protein TraN [Vibrio cholerae]MCX9716096.1 conjugal transfer protein TraN [Vibrio cholerae]
MDVIKGLLVLACAWGFSAHSAVNMQQEAKNISDLSQSMTGSKEALNTNVISPLSGGGSLKTFDRKEDFSFSIGTCSASEVFLKILTQPQSSGRLRLLAIEQDTSLDGNLDKFINVNMDADMVCSNGIMQCTNVDDFSTCSSFKWSAASDRTVGLTRVGMSELGGCYCISGKCGNALAWRNLKQVLTDVAGGISASLAAVNPYYTMSGVTVEGTQATVTGGNAQCATGSVTDLVSTTDPKKLASYQNDPNKMKQDSQTETASSWAYQAIQSGSLNPQESSEIRRCSEVRQPIIDSAKLSDIITLDSGTGGVGYCGADCIMLTLGTVGDNYWNSPCGEFGAAARFFIKDYKRIKSAVLEKAIFDDWIQILLNGNYIWSGPYNNWTGQAIPGQCELNTSWNINPNVSFKHLFNKNGVAEFKMRVMVADAGEGYAFARLTADLSCKDTKTDTIANSCSVYQNDPECTLLEERVDGVLTFSSGAITGLNPLPQSKTISQDSCQITIQRPWFNKNRTYRCNVKTQSDLTKAIARSEKIKTSTTAKDYQDIQFKNGGIVGDSGTLNFDNLPTVQPCVQACKVRKPVYPDVALDGVDKGVVNPTHYDVTYKECSVGVCPLSSGEELVQACQCTNDFAEATAIMQIMRNAGQDMICSTGIEKPL